MRNARFEPGTAASAVGHTIPMIRHIFALVITASFIPKFFVYRFALVFFLFVLNCVFFPFVEVLHVHVKYSSYIYCIFFLLKKTDVSKRKVHTTKMIFVTKNAILYIVVLTIIFVYIIRNCSLFKSFSVNIKNNYFHMRQGFKWKLIF